MPTAEPFCTPPPRRAFPTERSARSRTCPAVTGASTVHGDRGGSKGAGAGWQSERSGLRPRREAGKDPETQSSGEDLGREASGGPRPREERPAAERPLGARRGRGRPGTHVLPPAGSARLSSCRRLAGTERGPHAWSGLLRPGERAARGAACQPLPSCSAGASAARGPPPPPPPPTARSRSPARASSASSAWAGREDGARRGTSASRTPRRALARSALRPGAQARGRSASAAGDPQGRNPRGGRPLG